MEEWKIILLTGGISVVSSNITALITLSRTHRNEVKKLIWEKRSVLYFELYNVVEEMLSDRYKIYDNEYVKKIVQFKPKMKLLASPKTVEAFKNLFDFIAHHYNAFHIYLKENEKLSASDEQSMIASNEDHKSKDSYSKRFSVNIKEIDTSAFDETIVATQERISEKATALYEHMRKDLGSNIK